MKRNKAELKNTRQFKRASENEHCYIRFDMRLGLKLDLSLTENAVYQVVRHFNYLKNGAYTGSIQGLQVYLNASYSAISKALTSLISRNLLEKKVDEHGNVHYIDPSITPEARKKRQEFIENVNKLKNDKSSHFKNERTYTPEELDNVFAIFETFEV